MHKPRSTQKPHDRYHRRGVVGVIHQDARFLVIRRSAHVSAPLKICFPGGGIEPGETAEPALRRELAEELGIVDARIGQRLWTSITPWNVHLQWWEVDISPATRITPNPDEVAAFHWWTAEQMLAAPDLLGSNREFLAFWHTRT